MGARRIKVAWVLQLARDVIQLGPGELGTRLSGLGNLSLPHQVPEHVDDEVRRRIKAGTLDDLLDLAVEGPGYLYRDLALSHCSTP